MTRFVYHARPIDQVKRTGQPLSTSSVVSNAKGKSRAAWFNPSKAWMLTNGPYPDSKLQRINHHILGMCDRLVAELPADVATIGTILEISEAVKLEIPTLIVTDIVESWALEYLEKPSMVSIVNLNELTTLPGDIDEAVESIARFASD